MNILEEQEPTLRPVLEASFSGCAASVSCTRLLLGVRQEAAGAGHLVRRRRLPLAQLYGTAAVRLLAVDIDSSARCVASTMHHALWTCVLILAATPFLRTAPCGM